MSYACRLASAILASVVVATVGVSAAARAEPLDRLAPLSKGELSKLAGGFAVATPNVLDTSTIEGNTIGNIAATGLIGGNTLSGNSGVTTFIANSGNQVSISQSTVVNVYLH